MQSVALLSFVLLGLFLLLTYSSKAEASPILNNELMPTVDEDQKINVADFLRVLESLQDELDARREIMAASAKRGLDLGLSRGFSGSQAAKHLMGLAAANFAGGPGRRRRSTQQ